jgi:Phage protein Gp138 N-terminal domain
MTLADLMTSTLERHAAELHVCLPGTVDSYDSGLQTVDVVPSVGDSQGVISQVPLVFPAAGGYAMTLPVSKGDRVVLVFADMSLDEWWTGRATAPADSRSHSRTDCFALLGGRPGSSPLVNVDASRAVFGASDSASPRIAVGSSAVHLGVGHGAAATESVILGSTFKLAFDTFVTALCACVGPLSPIAVAATTLQTSLAVGYTSQIVKVK